MFCASKGYLQPLVWWRVWRPITDLSPTSMKIVECFKVVVHGRNGFLAGHGTYTNPTHAMQMHSCGAKPSKSRTCVLVVDIAQQKEFRLRHWVDHRASKFRIYRLDVDLQLVEARGITASSVVQIPPSRLSQPHTQLGSLAPGSTTEYASHSTFSFPS